MKRYLLTLIFLIATSFVAQNLFAESFSATNSDGVTIYYNTLTETTCEVGRGNYSGSVNIPSTVKNNNITYTVTEIGRYAFMFCNNLTSVTIPNTVKYIRYGAFYECSSLTSLKIPDSVIGIDEFAFSDCYYLAQLTLGKNLETIGEQAFDNCGISSLTLPNSVKTIKGNAFGHCEKLTSVTIPKGVNTITSNPFSDCTNLGSIVVESGNTIYNSANNCNAIIETSTTTLISGCKNTKIPNNITAINHHAFSGCYSLTEVTIPSSVTSKGKVYTVTSIGSSSMRGLDATAIVIPATIKSIGEMAFLECKKLKTLSVDADNPNYCAVDNVLMTKGKKKIILYPSCKTGSDYTIPATIDAIERYAFGNCKLRSVTIPAATVAIPSTAFSGCLHLSTINVSDNNANYSSQDNVLMSKDGKTLLRYPAGKQDNAYTVPLSVEQIEREAFSECNLAYLYIKNENIKIADYAFRDCRNLSTVQIPSKIAPELDRTVFADCDRLETITLDGDGRSISAESYKEGGRDKVYDTVEQMPSFPGGPEALFSWIKNNLKYPAEAEENGVQGRVVCAFVVERDGSIRNIQVVKSIYPSLDAEAIRLLNKMPRWSPGKQSGIPVRTKFTLPFTFKLQ
jgi:TonB family protein